MSDMPPDQAPNEKDPLEGCTRLAVVVLSPVIAPIAAGLALEVEFTAQMRARPTAFENRGMVVQDGAQS